MCGRNRAHMASMTNSPRECAAARISSVSRALTVKGFSTRTGLPASRASIAASRWALCGVATYTASTSGSATSPSYVA